MAELADAVDALEAWERGVAVTLQGADGSFCAGADLPLAREHLVSSEDGRLMSMLMTDTLARLRRCARSRNDRSLQELSQRTCGIFVGSGRRGADRYM